MLNKNTKTRTPGKYFVWTLMHDPGFYLILDSVNKKAYHYNGVLLEVYPRGGFPYPEDRNWIAIPHEEYLKCIVGGLPYLKDKYEYYYEKRKNP